MGNDVTALCLDSRPITAKPAHRLELRQVKTGTIVALRKLMFFRTTTRSQAETPKPLELKKVVAELLDTRADDETFRAKLELVKESRRARAEGVAP
ncbi:MAG: hypothetical protein JWM82_549 [Myxococcales bacterium]|nr:hypothetical protein [Myxococcales bacterium]